ncbi:branched-chain amino acid ABC transporter permease [Tissierella sp.]|uniref:branched-chain amino acid ABC transporter permease n=1 Tax=Tissierella sp. TaxID=41274 RepID=UPI002859621A|nr:branched-chain amino acid ABC transporter permease [Tissierella sp.]MDR7855331.1 branched-chain amino acid ABC transporter permease [Tissierella sp.]
MQTLIFALAYGSMYALLALAINIVVSTTYIINFAHASIVMTGAMVAYWCIGVYQLPYFVGLLAGILVNIVLSIIIYKLCVEKLGNLHNNIGWIITLFGASLILDNVARMIFGLQANAFPYLFGGQRIIIFGANIYIHEIVMILIAAAIGISYQMMCNGTKIGRALRAVSVKPEAAKLMGIDSNFMIIISFALAGAVAAIAGCLIAPYTYASYMMTSSIGLKGFAAALIGGIGNTKGAFLGGIALGLIEQLLSILGVPPSFLNSFSFIIMILVIVFLPGGIVNARIFNRSKIKAEKI